VPNQEDLQQGQQTLLVATLLIEQVIQSSVQLKMQLIDDKKIEEDGK
jgi:hypothetical protein